MQDGNYFNSNIKSAIVKKVGKLSQFSATYISQYGDIHLGHRLNSFYNRLNRSCKFFTQSRFLFTIPSSRVQNICLGFRAECNSQRHYVL